MSKEGRNAASGSTVTERGAVCVEGDTTVLEATRLMRSFRVAQLVVAECSTGAWTPRGIVSARDIVTRVIAAGLDPNVVTAGDIAWSDFGTPGGCADGVDSLRSQQAAETRYLPVLSGNGGIAGFVFLS
ncbi:MAG: CBS domain-containing protein [Betaproteobacteria bacterium]|nr:MAG: CBS domain-containing protein [Betaproteobacteria bacterium]